LWRWRPAITSLQLYFACQLFSFFNLRFISHIYTWFEKGVRIFKSMTDSHKLQGIYMLSNLWDGDVVSGIYMTASLRQHCSSSCAWCLTRSCRRGLPSEHAEDIYSYIYTHIYIYNYICIYIAIQVDLHDWKRCAASEHFRIFTNWYMYIGAMWSWVDE
jgi:hypothetical protein